MKTNLKKVLALLLALVMVASCFAGCDNNSDEPTADPSTATQDTQNSDSTEPSGEQETLPDYKSMEYDDASTAIYDAVLGDFYSAYQTSLEASSQSERWALMAIAEAKLLEAGVMLPCTSNGGLYAISRIVPKTAPNTLWGNDMYRFHNVLVTNEFLRKDDRAALKAMWAELKGTGTYEAKAIEYLTGKGYTMKDTRTQGYTANPETWDVLATSRSNDSEAIVNTYDGLYEYDCEGTLQPALAVSSEVVDNEDGTSTVTFKLREGVKWVDSQGREVGTVKADDFVAGMQHMLDAQAGLEYLVSGIIKNAAEYISGEVTDFAEVGVKAVDDTTLVYELTAPCSYFMTMLGYGVFAPMNRDYFLSKGGAFGADEFAAAKDSGSYTYGTTPDDIAYCGPYLVTNYTADNTIVFQANPTYWNADNIVNKSIVWLFNDGSDPMKAYNDAVAGTLDGANLTAAPLEVAKTDGNFDNYSYVSDTDATSFMAFLNINRNAYANANDNTVCVSTKTDDQKNAAYTALLNTNFRLAIMQAVDRGTYNAQVVGEDLKLTSLRNSYTPGTFVSLPEDVTVEINGNATTFAAGTFYGAIMQAQLTADGMSITVWDPTADDGIGSSDSFDGWYNVDAAKASFEAAKTELAAQGVEISAENPIVLDIPYAENSEIYTNKVHALKQSIEAAFGGEVVVNCVGAADTKGWMAAGYTTDTGDQANYDIYDLSGWGPDYGDPQTYLDTFLPDYAGYMVKCVGLF